MLPRVRQCMGLAAHGLSLYTCIAWSLWRVIRLSATPTNSSALLNMMSMRMMMMMMMNRLQRRLTSTYQTYRGNWHRQLGLKQPKSELKCMQWCNSNCTRKSEGCLKRSEGATDWAMGWTANKCHRRCLRRSTHSTSCGTCACLHLGVNDVVIGLMQINANLLLTCPVCLWKNCYRAMHFSAE